MSKETSPPARRNARTWETNADEFRLLDRGEGWPFAVLVACSAFRSKRGGQDESAAAGSGKVPMSTFAHRAGTDGNRIGRYLAAWEKAAAAGLVPAATDLHPSDAPAVALPDVAWSAYYDASTDVVGGHRAPTDAVRAIEKHGVAAVLDALPPERTRELQRAVVEKAGFEDLQRLRSAADDRIAARMPEVDADNARRRAEREAEEARSASFWRWNRVSGDIAAARDRLRDALRVAQLNGDFTEDERADMAVGLDRLDAASGLLRLAITGTVDIDWDAELQRMGDQ